MHARKTETTDLLALIAQNQDITQSQDLLWQGSFAEYLEMVREDPNIARTAHQRVFDLIQSYGSCEYSEGQKTVTRYHFFDDPVGSGSDAVFGVDVHLMKVVRVLHAAALGYGSEHRLLLLHGPVGSAKSTIARLLKKGLEAYSHHREGRLYTYSWITKEGVIPCPMHEEPLRLLPSLARAKVLTEINRSTKGRYPVQIEGDLCPVCRHMYREVMSEVDGDFLKLQKHIRVNRMVFSEKDRVGIGTFQPKDEKNQDSTELTGDINYRLIAEYGSDSDPRAFNFDGEFNVANRGIIEFIEILKLDVAFLYDLLGAVQEHKIKPKKFPQTHIDELVLGHTNEPEYRRLQNNEYMEALLDRTIRIDIPYITRTTEEVRIYQRDFSPQRVVAHIAPHTLEMASLWGVLTRLEAPKDTSLSLLQKAKLYDGRNVSGFTDAHVKELRKAACREGLDGISPRFIQDMISSALVRNPDTECLNPLMVLRELEGGLKHQSTIASDEQRKHFLSLIGTVQQEYEDVVKAQVRRAVAADSEAMDQLCGHYIENLRGYLTQEKVRNAFTGSFEAPDEPFMRDVEARIEVDESHKDDFRRELLNYIGALSLEGTVFDYTMNDRLRQALERKLFDDSRRALVRSRGGPTSSNSPVEIQPDTLRDRLVSHHDYCEVCATGVLQFVASIFSRGETPEDAK